jgi:hypothetical protein
MHYLLGNNKKSSENNKIKSTLLSPLVINYELHNRLELKNTWMLETYVHYFKAKALYVS